LLDDGLAEFFEHGGTGHVEVTAGIEGRADRDGKGGIGGRNEERG
jgi:hypothetical protein